MIHEQIARYRKLKGLTQEQLGETLGVSNRTVSKWESGASLPGADMIPEIADALGVSLHTLYGIDTQQEEQDLAGLIRETIRKNGKDYRAETAPSPIPALQNRGVDNTTLGRVYQ